jgi:hypothetical protein
LDEAQGWKNEDQILRRALITTFLFGLVMHVIGFAIGAGVFGPADAWPASLAADLLATSGIALWTAAVIVLFLEVWPRATARRTNSFYRGVVAALRERGHQVPADAAASEDPVQAKLDVILARIGTIEAAVTPSARPDAPST